MRAAPMLAIALLACGDPYILNGYRSPMGVNGPRREPHSGVDFKGELGDPVIAAAPGIVSSIVDNPVAGKAVLIWHDRARYTVYLHLSAIEVAAGQCVRRGQEIGKLGSTGSGSGGRPHVHLQLCDYPCKAGTGDGQLEGVEDPMTHGAECFVPGRLYDARTLTYPIVCDDAQLVPVPADPNDCYSRLSEELGLRR